MTRPTAPVEQAFKRVFSRDFNEAGLALCRVADALVGKTDYDAGQKRYIRSYVEVARRVAQGTVSMFELDGALPRNLEQFLEEFKYFFTEDETNADFGVQAIVNMVSDTYPKHYTSEATLRRVYARLAKVIEPA